MGLLSRLGLRPKITAPPPVESLAMPVIDAIMSDMSVEKLWAEQPHLRTVTDFIARSVSSISLHVYERQDDGGRERIRDTSLARSMYRANPSQTMQDVLHSSIMDLCLYDEFLWYVDPIEGHIWPISPLWVRKYLWADPWTLKGVILHDDKTGLPFELPAEHVIRVAGYQPGTYKRGLSPVHALRDVLREQLESAAYRGQLWRQGPRISGVIERPQGARWEPSDRHRFKQSLHAQYTYKGSGAGGVMLLEDGMKFMPMHLKASDEQIVDVAKLSLATVASAFHVNPTMVGLLDNANYSNVREFRRSLYGDSLGPIIKRVETALNAFLLPMVGEDNTKVYIEFNLEEKLRASFEEEAEIITKAVGGPWLTVNEARARKNLPTVANGDELIVPLNTVQGQLLGGDTS